MAFPINAEKAMFKKLFKEEVDKIPRGKFINDLEIQTFLSSNNINISFNSAMDCIRHLEDDLGINLKKRLKRVKNEGYIVLEPEIQVTSALKEGKHKVKIALGKTARRLESVEVSSFTPAQQRELLNRTAAIDSLLNIVQNSSITKKIMNRKEVELLQHTALQTKAIKRIS